MKQGGAISSEPWLLSDGSKILNERRHIDAFRKDEHFTMYAEKSVGLRIFAGSEKGETVLDPFFGSGTRGAGAKRLGGGGYIGIELNPKFCEKAYARNENVVKE